MACKDLQFGLKASAMIEFEPTTWRSEFLWFVAALLAISMISPVTLDIFPG